MPAPRDPSGLDVIISPFTDEQVKGLNEWQECGTFHPFTCGRRSLHDGEGILVATRNGWICSDPECTYRQYWAHAFMAKGDPAK